MAEEVDTGTCGSTGITGCFGVGCGGPILFELVTAEDVDVLEVCITKGQGTHINDIRLQQRQKLKKLEQRKMTMRSLPRLWLI